MKINLKGNRMCRFYSALTLIVAVAAPICLLPFLVPNVIAEETPMMIQLLGRWEGHGKLFGVDATFSMTWESVLEEKFVRLTFQNKMHSGDGAERIFKAQAFYRSIGAGQIEGTWFDSRGIVQPLRGNADDTTLTINWGTPETEEGRTIYRLKEGRIEVEDFVLKGDKWQQFGSATYERL